MSGNRKFDGIKLGDSVFVAEQRSARQERNNTPQRTYTTPVVKVGRKYAYILQYGKPSPFHITNGESHHAGDCNARSNCMGFDVFHSEQEWQKHEETQSIRRAFYERMNDHFLKRKLSDDAVIEINAILDRELGNQ